MAQPQDFAWLSGFGPLSFFCCFHLVANTEHVFGLAAVIWVRRTVVGAHLRILPYIFKSHPNSSSNFSPRRIVSASEAFFAPVGLCQTQK